MIECTEEDIAKLQGTAFAHFLALNAIELKGPNDPYTITDYNRVLMRVWGLGATKPPKEDFDSQETVAYNKPVTIDDLPPHQLYGLPKRRTLTVICVTRPLKILKWLKDQFDFRPVKPGVYHYEGRISEWIICPSELRLTPKNYPLLALSKGKKLSDFIDVCLKEELFDYLELVMYVGVKIDPDTIWQKMKEVKKMSIKIRPETLGYIDEFFRHSPDFFDDVPFIQDKMAEREQLGEQRGQQHGKLLAKQQMLLTLLGQKFASVPDYVVKQIEFTTDEQQLEGWLKQILKANTLQEMGFSTASTNGTNGSTNGKH